VRELWMWGVVHASYFESVRRIELQELSACCIVRI